MREKIYIKNIGPLKEVEIDELLPFTVLIGASASGKSTLMKVIALFRYLYKMQNIRSYLRNSNIIRSPFRFRFDRLIKENGLDTYFSGESEVVYTTIFEDGTEYKISYNNGKLYTDVQIDDLHTLFSKESFISETRNILANWTNKPIQNRNSSLGFYFHETSSDFEEATDNVTQLSLDYLQMAFNVKKIKGRKNYYIGPSDDSFKSQKMDAVSSGVQTSTPLMVIIHYYTHFFSFNDAFRRSVFQYLFEGDRLSKFQPKINIGEMRKMIHIHVEEPELSLDPTAQRSMLNAIVHEINGGRKDKSEMKLMLATHSPYILNQLNLLMKAHDAGKTVEDAQLDYDKTAVYLVSDGGIRDLKVKNARLVDTIRLSEDINDIYERYDEIG
jgi:AAA15 family ATPase/GTPase